MARVVAQQLGLDGGGVEGHEDLGLVGLMGIATVVVAMEAPPSYRPPLKTSIPNAQYSSGLTGADRAMHHTRSKEMGMGKKHSTQVTKASAANP